MRKSSLARDARRLGEALRRIRRKRGLTQEQLAQRIGGATSTVARTERGEGNPGLETLSALAGALEVGVAELFGAEPERPPEAVGRDLERRIRALRQARNGKALAFAEAVLDRLVAYTA